jgi:hypothetical protein
MLNWRTTAAGISALVPASWKTTAAGTAMLVPATGDVVYQIVTRSWDWSRLGNDVVGVFGGIGLIFAKDHNVTGGTTPQ